MLKSKKSITTVLCIIEKSYSDVVLENGIYREILKTLSGMCYLEVKELLNEIRVNNVILPPVLFNILTSLSEDGFNGFDMETVIGIIKEHHKISKNTERYIKEEMDRAVEDNFGPCHG